MNPSDADRGSLTVIGLGPGDPALLTGEATRALEEAEVLYGYGPYLARVPMREGQRRVESDNRQELERARAAWMDAAAGARVAVVSGGDPGVFGMAAAVCEALETGPESWRGIRLSITPGVTAMLALAARLGAPLGHDFCAISLSDNLKPWDVVEARLRAVASAGFVIALYNPISRHRPWQLGRALVVLGECLAPHTPVALGQAIGRHNESMEITQLAQVRPESANMSTCVIIGTAESRLLARGDLPPLLYTPRSMPSPSTERT
jgi:precorrin-3B C17-methyltransferase